MQPNAVVVCVVANEMQLVIYLCPNPVRSFRVDVWDQTRRYLQCGPPQHSFYRLESEEARNPPY